MNIGAAKSALVYVEDEHAEIINALRRHLKR
jgi:hypothetical protein